MFSYFDYLLKQLLIEKYPNTSNDYSDLDCINEKIITEEYRKFLDKVAIRMTTDMFEREEYVNAILKLARMERIIIAFNIIQGIELREIAYLLNTSADSVYSQKNTALKRLKAELSNNKFYIIKAITQNGILIYPLFIFQSVHSVLPFSRFIQTHYLSVKAHFLNVL